MGTPSAYLELLNHQNRKENTMAQLILNLEPDEILRAFTIGAKNEGFVCCSKRGLMPCPAGSPHETKSHARTEFLVTRNQSKHPDRGCAKASHDGRISGRGELDRASPKKMYEKFWTLSLSEEFRPLLQNSSKSCPAKYFPSKFLTAQRALCPTRAYTC